jgi:hypothetical protein
MGTLHLIIGLYAGKLEYFIGPLSLELFGKIQSRARGEAQASEGSASIPFATGVFDSCRSRLALLEPIRFFFFFRATPKKKIIENKLKMENEQSAGNLDHSDSNVEFSKLIEKNLHISDHMDKHVKPKTDIEFGYYLAGLIEGDG